MPFLARPRLSEVGKRSQTQAKMFSTADETRTWPELAIGLYDKQTGRDAEINYRFDDFERNIPSSTAADADQALEKMNASLCISRRSNAVAIF